MSIIQNPSSSNKPKIGRWVFVLSHFIALTPITFFLGFPASVIAATEIHSILSNALILGLPINIKKTFDILPFLFSPIGLWGLWYSVLLPEEKWGEHIGLLTFFAVNGVIGLGVLCYISGKLIGLNIFGVYLAYIALLSMYKLSRFLRLILLMRKNKNAAKIL